VIESGRRRVVPGVHVHGRGGVVEETAKVEERALPEHVAGGGKRGRRGPEIGIYLRVDAVRRGESLVEPKVRGVVDALYRQDRVCGRTRGSKGSRNVASMFVEPGSGAAL
jgi:hypothetical protein